MLIKLVGGKSQFWQDLQFIETGEIPEPIFSVEIDTAKMTREERSMLLPFIKFDAPYSAQIIYILKQGSEYGFIEFDSKPSVFVMLSVLADEYRKANKLPPRFSENVHANDEEIERFWEMYVNGFYITSLYIFN